VRRKPVTASGVYGTKRNPGEADWNCGFGRGCVRNPGAHRPSGAQVSRRRGGKGCWDGHCSWELCRRQKGLLDTSMRPDFTTCDHDGRAQLSRVATRAPRSRNMRGIMVFDSVRYAGAAPCFSLLRSVHSRMPTDHDNDQRAIDSASPAPVNRRVREQAGGDFLLSEP
jgi:hypothetical protein